MLRFPLLVSVVVGLSTGAARGQRNEPATELVRPNVRPAHPPIQLAAIDSSASDALRPWEGDPVAPPPDEPSQAELIERLQSTVIDKLEAAGALDADGEPARAAALIHQADAELAREPDSQVLTPWLASLALLQLANPSGGDFDATSERLGRLTLRYFGRDSKVHAYVRFLEACRALRLRRYEAALERIDEAIAGYEQAGGAANELAGLHKVRVFILANLDRGDEALQAARRNRRECDRKSGPFSFDGFCWAMTESDVVARFDGPAEAAILLDEYFTDRANNGPIDDCTVALEIFRARYELRAGRPETALSRLRNVAMLAGTRLPHRESHLHLCRAYIEHFAGNADAARAAYEQSLAVAVCKRGEESAAVEALRKRADHFAEKADAPAGRPTFDADAFDNLLREFGLLIFADRYAGFLMGTMSLSLHDDPFFRVGGWLAPRRLELARPRLGLELEVASSDAVPGYSGALRVKSVTAHSAAAEHGVRQGDLLLSVDNRPTVSPSSLWRHFELFQNRPPYSCKLLRGGKEIEVNLGATPVSAAQPVAAILPPKLAPQSLATQATQSLATQATQSLATQTTQSPPATPEALATAKPQPTPKIESTIEPARPSDAGLAARLERIHARLQSALWLEADGLRRQALEAVCEADRELAAEDDSYYLLSEQFLLVVVQLTISESGPAEENVGRLLRLSERYAASNSRWRAIAHLMTAARHYADNEMPQALGQVDESIRIHKAFSAEDLDVRHALRRKILMRFDPRDEAIASARADRRECERRHGPFAADTATYVLDEFDANRRFDDAERAAGLLEMYALDRARTGPYDPHTVALEIYRVRGDLDAGMRESAVVRLERAAAMAAELLPHRKPHFHLLSAYLNDFAGDRVKARAAYEEAVATAVRLRGEECEAVASLRARRPHFLREVDQVARPHFDAAELDRHLQEFARLIVGDRSTGAWHPWPVALKNDPFFHPGGWVTAGRIDDVRERLGIEFEMIEPADGCFVRVKSVKTPLPGAVEGLRAGDRILHFGDTQFVGPTAIWHWAGAEPRRPPVRCTVLRDGKQIQLSLGSTPPWAGRPLVAHSPPKNPAGRP